MRKYLKRGYARSTYIYFKLADRSSHFSYEAAPLLGESTYEPNLKYHRRLSQNQSFLIQAPRLIIQMSLRSCTQVVEKYLMGFAISSHRVPYCIGGVVLPVFVIDCRGILRWTMLVWTQLLTHDASFYHLRNSMLPTRCEEAIRRRFGKAYVVKQLIMRSQILCDCSRP